MSSKIRPSEYPFNQPLVAPVSLLDTPEEFIEHGIHLFLQIPLVTDRASLRTRVARLAERTYTLREANYRVLGEALDVLRRVVTAANNRDALLERRETEDRDPEYYADKIADRVG